MLSLVEFQISWHKNAEADRHTSPTQLGSDQLRPGSARWHRGVWAGRGGGGTKPLEIPKNSLTYCHATAALSNSTQGGGGQGGGVAQLQSDCMVMCVPGFLSHRWGEQRSGTECLTVCNSWPHRLPLIKPKLSNIFDAC